MDSSLPVCFALLALAPYPLVLADACPVRTRRCYPPPQSLSAFEWPVHVYIFAFWIREMVGFIENTAMRHRWGGFERR